MSSVLCTSLISTGERAQLGSSLKRSQDLLFPLLERRPPIPRLLPQDEPGRVTRVVPEDEVGVEAAHEERLSPWLAREGLVFATYASIVGQGPDEAPAEGARQAVPPERLQAGYEPSDHLDGVLTSGGLNTQRIKA